MRFEIKNATTERMRKGNLITYGVLQLQGGNGTPDVPGGGGKGYALFHLNHSRIERERWNRQQRNFEKMQRQTARLINKLNGFGCAGNNNKLEPKHRTNN